MFFIFGTALFVAGRIHLSIDQGGGGRVATG
jgi:hypothetical protein